jgi:hypothetical protein
VIVRSTLLALLTTCCLHPVAAQAQSDVPQFRFPPEFKGEDCDSIVAMLKKVKVSKDEFETTADFTQRVQSVLGSTSVADKPLSEPKYFVNSDRTSAVYDADKGVLRVYGSLRQSTKVSEAIKYAQTVIVKTRSAESSEYRGQNNFGASTAVKKYRDEICGVAFVNLSPVTDHEWMGKIEFPLLAETARQSKGNIAIVYLSRLTTPLLVEHRQYIAPTMSSPSEILVTGDALVTTLERFFIVNRATGAVLFERQYTPR